MPSPLFVLATAEHVDRVLAPIEKWAKSVDIWSPLQSEVIDGILEYELNKAGFTYINHRATYCAGATS